MTFETAEFVEVYSLSKDYDGVKIINEPKIRSVKEHNSEVRKRRANKPKELVLV